MVFAALATSLWHATVAVASWCAQAVWLCVVGTGLLLVVTAWPLAHGSSSSSNNSKGGGHARVLRAVRHDVYRQLFARPTDSTLAPATSLWGMVWDWLEVTSLSAQAQRARTARHAQTARARQWARQLVEAARARGILRSDDGDADADDDALELRAFGGPVPNDADDADAARTAALLGTLTPAQRHQLHAQCPEPPGPPDERLGNPEHSGAAYGRAALDQAEADRAAAGRPAPHHVHDDDDAWGRAVQWVARWAVTLFAGVVVVCVAVLPVTLVAVPCVSVVSFYHQAWRHAHKLALAGLVAVWVAAPASYGGYVARLGESAVLVTLVRVLVWLARNHNHNNHNNDDDDNNDTSPAASEPAPAPRPVHAPAVRAPQ